MSAMSVMKGERRGRRVGLAVVLAAFWLAAWAGAAWAEGCIQGDCVNGVGTYVFANGQTHSGEWRNDKANGQGTRTWPNGEKYVGEFRDGKFNGQGTYTFPSGEKYVGEFRDGQPNGQGTRTWPNGEKYVGEFRDDQANGQGTRTWPSGEKYVGEYRGGKPNGQGTHTLPNGEKYVGEFRDGKENGLGVQTYPDGRIQRGIWWRSGGGRKNLGQALSEQEFAQQARAAGLNTVLAALGLAPEPGKGAQALDLADEREQLAEEKARLERERIELAERRKQAAEPRVEPRVEPRLETPPESRVEPLAKTLTGRRVALVIGNGAYGGQATLRNPPADARDISAALRRAGFSVTTLIDADRRTMIDAIQDFGDKARDSVALFFFAGHGLQARGENYLVPIAAKLRSEADAEHEAVNAQRVLDQMLEAKTRLNIVVLDACRNNPLTRSFKRSTSRGLAGMTAPQGSIVAFSTAPGQEAQDGSGRNSPYARHFLDKLSQRLGVEGFFKNVARGVINETKNEQRPWISSDFVGEFSFAAN